MSPIVLLAFFLLPGCAGLNEWLTADPETDYPSTPACGATAADVTGVVSAPVNGIVRTDLVVTGTASHPGGLAIRAVTVAGVAATNTGFNFSTWSVTVPIGVLVAEATPTAEDPDVGTASIIADASDACEQTDTIDEIVGVQVDLTPVSEVEELSLALVTALPDGVAYLPSDGSYPVMLQVTANADAVGASVNLTASAGTFSGADATGAVVLGGDGVAAATANVQYSAAGDGPVLLYASADDQIAALALSAAGTPTLVPSNGELLAGQSTQVTALSDGTIARCIATASDAGVFTADSGNVDLLGAWGAPVDGNGDGSPEITVAVGADATTAATLVLTCEDVYGQASSAEFTFTPQP